MITGLGNTCKHCSKYRQHMQAPKLQWLPVLSAFVVTAALACVGLCLW